MQVRLIVLSLVLLAAGCATPIDSGSHCTVEPGYLDTQDAFSWYSVPAVDLDDRTGYISPAIVKGLERAVIGELQGKGLKYVERSESQGVVWPDVQVSLVFRVRREVVSMSMNDSPCTSTDCWERVDMGASARMEVRTIGFLAADVYYLGEPIWRGWVERTLYPDDRDNAGEVVREAIPKLFESFPP